MVSQLEGVLHMGALSIWHLLIVLVVVLVFFGPRKLPELGKGLGEAIRGFKKGLEGGEIDVTDARRDSLKQGENAEQSKNSAAKASQKTGDSNEG